MAKYRERGLEDEGGSTMKIKVALLDKDKTYLDRIAGVFNARYMEELEIYAFTELNTALAALQKYRIDVLIADDSFDVNVDDSKIKSEIAYFVESHGIEKIKERPAICKYQKSEVIYKQILNLFSDKVDSIQKAYANTGRCKTILFSSPSGGTGTMTMSIAASLFYQKHGNRVFYLNLDPLNSSDLILGGESQFTMSDAIFAVKSRKGNLDLKLESYMCSSLEGVGFFRQAKVALDMLELKGDDIDILVNSVEKSGKYDVLIINKPFRLSKAINNYLKKYDAMVSVSDGSDEVNYRLVRAFDSLQLMLDDEILLDKIKLIYNKFGSETGKMLSTDRIATIGGAPKYKGATTRQIAEKLSEMTFWEDI